ncbi:hypothetical protein [Marinimicrobium sp. ARAG 43.8]|uniref:hypothetical protein n=1 Tax=Marinimicrobium sp. ARAG 43.8 TaxID=3418719 RepID=UPI003CE88B5F
MTYRLLIAGLTGLALMGCDTSEPAASDVGAAAEPSGVARFEGTFERVAPCPPYSALQVDIVPRDRAHNKVALVRAEGEKAVYGVIDHLELPPRRSGNEWAPQTNDKGWPMYDWRTYLTKNPGVLQTSEGDHLLPEEAVLSYDVASEGFVLEGDKWVCASGVDNGRAGEKVGQFRKRDDRLVLRKLNEAMVPGRAVLYQASDRNYRKVRREYLGGSGENGVTPGHKDRNRHLQAVAVLMQEDARGKVAGLARLVEDHRPSDAGARQRYDRELPMYLDALARAHVAWYVDSADIRLDWFHGNYPEGEADIMEGIQALEEAYSALASEQ